MDLYGGHSENRVRRDDEGLPELAGHIEVSYFLIIWTIAS